MDFHFSDGATYRVTERANMCSVDAKFPLFVFEKDDRSMLLIESPERVLHQLEAIDIENDEYLFWDSSEAGIRISVARGAVTEIARCEQAVTLQEGLETYANSYGLRFIAGESAIDAWRRLQSQVPPKRSLWARLFGKSPQSPD